jgi:hypothetical protein
MSDTLTVQIRTFADHSDSQVLQFDPLDTVGTIRQLYNSLGLVSHDHEFLLLLDGAVLDPSTKLADLPLIVDDQPNPMIAFQCRGASADFTARVPGPEHNQSSERVPSEPSGYGDLFEKLRKEVDPEVTDDEVRIAAWVCVGLPGNQLEIARHFFDDEFERIGEEFVVEVFDEACWAVWNSKRVNKSETFWRDVDAHREVLFDRAVPFGEGWNNAWRLEFYEMAEGDKMWLAENDPRAFEHFRNAGRDREATLKQLAGDHDSA